MAILTKRSERPRSPDIARLSFGLEQEDMAQAESSKALGFIVWNLPCRGLFARRVAIRPIRNIEQAHVQGSIKFDPYSD
jgi:hypothetical protein